MVDATQIPFEVRRAMCIEWAKRNNSDGPDKHMTNLAVAMLNAWPVQFADVDAKGRYVLMLVFPLPQKDAIDE